MKTVLAAVDLEGSSSRVAGVASGMAAALGAQLLLFHVFAVPDGHCGFRPPSDDADGMIEMGRREALGRLSELAHDAGDASVQAVCSNGLPAEAISREARRVRAELIVIGSNGHGMFHELVLGGTGRELLRHAPCPVLIIPAQVPEPQGVAACS